MFLKIIHCPQAILMQMFYIEQVKVLSLDSKFFLIYFIFCPELFSQKKLGSN